MTIITIGIGRADQDELTQMATDENHVFMLEQYEYLKDKLNSLLKLTCESGKNWMSFECLLVFDICLIELIVRKGWKGCYLFSLSILFTTVLYVYTRLTETSSIAYC